MHPIFFKPRLRTKFSDDLEKIFFFNGNQKRHLERINQAVGKYGDIKLYNDKGFVKFDFTNLTSFKTIFSLDDENSEKANLLGVLIYRQTPIDNIELIHMAVNEACSFGGEFSNEEVSFRMIEKIRRDSSKNKLIKTFTLPYKKTKLSINQKLTKSSV
jgi:hypothetical protein